MGDPKGFLKVKRQKGNYRPVCERVKDYRQVELKPKSEESQQQASRCMDCGTPFCHWACPVGNYIPEWNDFLFKGHWEKAFELLNATNNLPEITGRVCPAVCEYACVLGINDDAVNIKENESAIIEYAFENNLIKPQMPLKRTRKKVAVIGSGPAGLACCMQLNRAGHNITVYEKDKKFGGILRYGIPDFKLEKWIIDRRLKLIKDEGVKFISSVHVGVDYKAEELLKAYDAICLAGGSQVPRDLSIPGRELKGIHFAMDYLVKSNKIVSGEEVNLEEKFDANGKKIVIVGGGDTGSDCVGTANRQGASCVVQIEIMPKPCETRNEEQPWPLYPMLLKTTSSHEEGAQREWSVLIKKFKGDGQRVKKLECSRIEFIPKEGILCPEMKEIPGSDFEIEADMVILAMGFLHTEHGELTNSLGIEFDNKGNVMTGSNFMTSTKKVFSAGDMRRGQSLVVHAVSEGRKAAHDIDKFLMGRTYLPEM